jgi:release factor glutamine methyltransferase
MTKIFRNVDDNKPPSTTIAIGLCISLPDAEPLLFYRTITKKGLSLLKPSGRLYIEINRAHGKKTMEMLAALGYTSIELRKDFAENDRMIRAVK